MKTLAYYCTKTYQNNRLVISTIVIVTL